MAPATDDRRRDAEGRILCEDCLIDGRGADCVSCGGSGFMTCERFGCKEAARIEGESGLFVYCGHLHAHEDDDWPSCIVCNAGAQDPAYGPFCGEACESKMRREIDERVHARWLERVAADNAEHQAAGSAQGNGTRFRSEA